MMSSCSAQYVEVSFKFFFYNLLIKEGRLFIIKNAIYRTHNLDCKIVSNVVVVEFSEDSLVSESDSYALQVFYLNCLHR